MQLAMMLKTTAAYWATLEVMTSIDWIALTLEDYYFPASADTVMYILSDIFICIIKEQWSDQDESKWKR